MFKTEQLSGKQQLENLDYQPNHRLQRKPRKDFYENQTLNREDRRNKKNTEVPWFRYNNGYIRNTQENLLKKLTASGLEHLDKINLRYSFRLFWIDKFLDPSEGDCSSEPPEYIKKLLD